MNSRTIQRQAMGTAAIAAAMLTLSGCQNGNVSHRDDGKIAAAVAAQQQSPLYEEQIREATAKLMRDHPGLTLRQAEAEARSAATASYELTGPTRAERERAETQDKFEDELAKLDK